MYVIFGATGQTGSAVADALLEKNQLVRVVLRSDKTAAAWRAKGADVAFADLSDSAAMTNAMRNADAVYAMNPPAYNLANMFAVARGIGERYVTAIKNSGAQKVVLLSSVGSQQASGTGNILTTHILEMLFSDLNIPVAFLRAAAFMENWSSVVKVAAEQGILPSFYTPLERKMPMVCAADIGRAVAQAMTEDWTGKRIIELHGAADYSPNDVAAAFAAALRRDVQAIAVPESEWQATISRFGFSPEAVSSYSEMMRGFNSGHVVFEGGSHVQTIQGQTMIADAVGKLIEAQA
ncbi:NmrA family NAD(P)-binding protein [Leptolyngbya sp. CCNP1308]|uniref:NmrA family NAD(P)-binding protein n=1 Tax=Leptolyngbya sp. CCNP1308 TaxID=3110255 RepID=UPI002B21E419|nr:NmrA family NAD(P)-binding protein [Leptolyngbya sp. CCNP1308]MEA5449536.1 NmrA family NAD(P)-binding protein [Leptolyngbya sp. CCNP1308]